MIIDANYGYWKGLSILIEIAVLKILQIEAKNELLPLSKDELVLSVQDGIIALIGAKSRTLLVLKKPLGLKSRINSSEKNTE